MAEMVSDYPTREEIERGFPTDDQLGGIGGIGYGEDESPAAYRTAFGIVIAVGFAAGVYLFLFGWLSDLRHWSDSDYQGRPPGVEPESLLGNALLRAAAAAVMAISLAGVYLFAWPWQLNAVAAAVAFFYIGLCWMRYMDQNGAQPAAASEEDRENSKAATGMISGIAFVATVVLTALYFLAISAYQGYQYLWPKIHHLLS